VGLRPGEKLSEELIGSEEVADPSGIEGILRIHPTSSLDPVHLREQVARLEALAAQGDNKAAVAQLSAIVPTFAFQRGERRRRPPRTLGPSRDITPRLGLRGVRLSKISRLSGKRCGNIVGFRRSRSGSGQGLFRRP
jgi:hypothetical protein